MNDAEQSTAVKHNRIHSMDELRGLAVILMVVYHICYTMGYIFGYPFGKVVISFFLPIAPFVPIIFIMISGISSDFSRSNIKRGAKLILFAIAVSLVTIFITPGSAIYFGILHFLSVAMILFGLLKPAFDKIPLTTGLIVTGLLYLLTYGVPMGMLGIPGFLCTSLPPELYQNDFLFFLGFHSNNFFSADYFPIFPNIFLFFFGTFLGRLALMGRFPKFLYKKRVPPLSFVGRHALIIYILHQPVIYGIFLLITTIFK